MISKKRCDGNLTKLCEISRYRKGLRRVQDSRKFDLLAVMTNQDKRLLTENRMFPSG